MECVHCLRNINNQSTAICRQVILVDIEVKYLCDDIIYHCIFLPIQCTKFSMQLVWKYVRMSFPFHAWNLPFRSILASSIFHTEISAPFHSIFLVDKELVVQNLRREPHSSVTVRRFRKLKSCCYVIAIPSGWHRCPNPNCNARFWSKNTSLRTYPSRFLHTASQFAQPIRESNPGEEGRELSVLTTRPSSSQHCSDKMLYLNQMYEKKAMACA